MDTYETVYPDRILDWMRDVTEKRETDVQDFDNLPKVFVRKVSREPVNSTDIIPQDKIGDFSFVEGYLYILINNSGTVKWQRTALADF